MRSAEPATRAAALERAGGARPGTGAERAEVEDLVAGALADDDPGVRTAAIRALVRLRATHSLRTLIESAGHDPAPSVRREAIAALARLVSPPRPGTSAPGPG
jgi:HEAT repeat protein